VSEGDTPYTVRVHPTRVLLVSREDIERSRAGGYEAVLIARDMAVLDRIVREQRGRCSACGQLLTDR
jgi:hypothetical protein